MSIFSIFAKKTQAQKINEQYQKSLKLFEGTVKDGFFSDVQKAELANQFKQLKQFLDDEKLPDEDKITAIDSRIRLLQKNLDNKNLLSEIACERFLSLLEKGKHEPNFYLKKFGGDINVPINDYNDTVLHLAIEEDYDLKVIKALVDSGADIGLKNKDQKTPCDIAKQVGGVKNSQYLAEILKQK